MLIAIDYDDTFSKDPQGWADVVILMKARGHKVIGCTMRYPDQTDGIHPLYSKVCDRIYYTSCKAKRDYLAIRDVKPDVWIDDRPEFIINSGV